MTTRHVAHVTQVHITEQCNLPEKTKVESRFPFKNSSNLGLSYITVKSLGLKEGDYFEGKESLYAPAKNGKLPQRSLLCDTSG